VQRIAKEAAVSRQSTQVLAAAFGSAVNDLEHQE
jgi:hypothetical protein